MIAVFLGAAQGEIKSNSKVKVKVKSKAKAVCSLRAPNLKKQDRVGTKCPHSNYDFEVVLEFVVDFDFRFWHPLSTTE